MSTLFRYEPEKNQRERKLTLDELDMILYKNEHGNTFYQTSEERNEQIIANTFILGTDSVLELGGRYGTVSATINNKLDDPYKHVVIEPEEAVIPCLLENRKTHNSYFTVYRNIICNRPKNIICAGYCTSVVDITGDEQEDNIIPSIKLEDIISHHGHSFNVLVADCEGCFEEFVKDNLDFVKELRLITYEQDSPQLSNYQNVANILHGLGFVCVLSGFHTVWIKKQEH